MRGTIGKHGVLRFGSQAVVAANASGRMRGRCVALSRSEGESVAGEGEKEARLEVEGKPDKRVPLVSDPGEGKGERCAVRQCWAGPGD
jgi:hypothetical protein